MLMPPPMVPAPITPTVSILRKGTPSGRSAILPAARSAPNTWRSARDSAVPISSMNAARSSRNASSNGLLRLSATISTHLRGAGYGPAPVATEFRANWRNASACGSWTLRSRRRLRGRFSATTFSARARAASTTSPSVTTSISAEPLKSEAGAVSPDRIMFSARSRPTARGRRWVPPAPGSSPSLTSGKAMRASARATR